ncbi:MAG TPA: hypothetical protein VGQ36_14585 [Thermoanaerobaculia bacterium]|jgi:hypothetical protein|nr:hypothetical protein [Thermoanaerobaculia bacterium]
MLPPTHREAIRAIFLKRRPEYTTRDAAQLLRMTLGEFLAWIETGVLDIEVRRKRRQLGGPRHALIPWKEVASAAMLRWTVVQIHDALGKDADGALPRLLWPVELKAVRLPAYQVRLLETLAQNSGVTVEEYVYTALLGVEAAASHAEIESMLPGFTEAVQFPNV